MAKPRLDVLVVDDEKKICEEITNHLTKKGLQNAYVLNASDALSVVKKEKPKLVIVDIFLPEFDGFDLADTILRKQPDCRIVLTSGMYDFSQQNLSNIGIADFINKPIKFDELDAIFKKYGLI